MGMDCSYRMFRRHKNASQVRNDWILTCHMNTWLRNDWCDTTRHQLDTHIATVPLYTVTSHLPNTEHTSRLKQCRQKEI